MNREILELKLKKNGVNEKYYSLFGELKPDSLVLYQNYNVWEVFYFSERGDRESLMSFNTESEACDYLYKTLIETKRIADEHNLNY